MVVKLFSVWDVKTGVFGSPFVAHNNGHALRMITDELKREGLFKNHPEDFELMNIGDYDDNSGVITGKTNPICVSRLSELVEKKNV